MISCGSCSVGVIILTIGFSVIPTTIGRIATTAKLVPHFASLDLVGEIVTPPPDSSDTILYAEEERDIQLSPLCSPNRKVVLQLDSAGNLVVARKCDDHVLWRQRVSSTAESKLLEMKANGNLVLLSLSGGINWESETSGHPGAELRLQDNGKLCVFHDDRCVWTNGQQFDPVTCNDEVIEPPQRSSSSRAKGSSSSGTKRRKSSTTKRPSMASRIEKIAPTGDDSQQEKTVLGVGQKQTLTNSRGALFSVSDVMAIGLVKQNGNNVLGIYRVCDRAVLWSPILLEEDESRRGAGGGTLELVMQSNGNLVLFKVLNRSSRKMIWASDTHDSGAVLKLHDDGLLCVYKEGECVWSSERTFTSNRCTDEEENEYRR